MLGITHKGYTKLGRGFPVLLGSQGRLLWLPGGDDGKNLGFWVDWRYQHRVKRVRIPT